MIAKNSARMFPQHMLTRFALTRQSTSHIRRIFYTRSAFYPLAAPVPHHHHRRQSFGDESAVTVHKHAQLQEKTPG